MTQTWAASTATSAWLQGTLVENGGRDGNRVWCHWGLEDGGTNAAAWAFTYAFGTNSDPTPKAYSNQATGLAPDRCYYSSYQRDHSVGGRGFPYWTRPARTFVTGQVGIEATDADASEAGPDTGTFTVSRPASATNGPLTVYYTVSGTASNGVDYAWLSGSVTIPEGSPSATITVTPIPDRLRDEPDETVTLTLVPGPFLPGAPAVATVTIANDPRGRDGACGRGRAGSGRGRKDVGHGV